MNSTNHATTWRDLAGELTPAQAERFAERDRLHGHEPGWQQLLLDQAREHARGNRIDSERFGDVPVPEGADVVDHWQVDPVEGGWFRYIEGRRWQVDGVDAGVLGTQFPDGRIERCVRVEADALDLGADGLRRIATALIEAAEELDRLSAH